VPVAHAALGDDAAAVIADQARFGASLEVRRRDAYVVHELTAATGTTIREYASGQGKVFAVSWSGGFRPNLRDLMGSHYERFVAALHARRARRGVVRLELPGMVVVMGGYLRTHFGRVVLTDLLPAGVLAEDLR
jgi:hypothetical protein